MKVGERNGAIIKDVLIRHPIRPSDYRAEHLGHLMSELFPFSHALFGPKMSVHPLDLGVNHYHYVYDNGSGLGIGPTRYAILFLGSIEDMILVKLAWPESYEISI